MERKPMLTKNELIYLKLFVYGYSKANFLEFYDLDASKITGLKMSIQSKFRTKNWRSIIRRAFYQDQIHYEDFVENTTKEIASHYAEVIFKILNSRVKISLKRMELRDQITEFLACCNYELAFQNTGDEELDEVYRYFQLTYKEKQLIELIYMDYKDSKIMAKILKVPRANIPYMKEQVLHKLQSNSWYNVIRKAFQFNVLDKEKFCCLDLSKRVSEWAKLMAKTKIGGKDDGITEKLQIYTGLIQMYNTFEYNYLLKNDFSEYQEIIDPKMEVA